MLRCLFLLIVSGVGVAVAAPLRFYVTPGRGFATHQPPLWVPDAAALSAAEQRAEQAEKNYAQGLGTALEAVRQFQLHAGLEAANDSPEHVAALKSRYESFAALVPLIQQRGEKQIYDASAAPRRLERMRQQYESAQKQLQKK